MSLPTLDGAELCAGVEPSASFVSALRSACETWGAFAIAQSPLACKQRALIDAANAFFALPGAQKHELDIARSSSFRGYSRLHSNADDREQLHLGPEPGARSNAGHHAVSPDYLGLLGPNLWPRELGDEWRQTVLDYMAVTGELGARLLRAVALAFELPVAPLLELLTPTPYLLLKLMRYAAPGLGAATKMAPHCDWSLLTILLQQGTGLEVLTPRGTWTPIPADPDHLLVSIGELLEVASAGCLRATPHRVSGVLAEPRLSVPVFINPDMARVVRPLRPRRPVPAGEVQEHVHRVRPCDAAPSQFLFGESEWERKGKGRWCYRLQCLTQS